MSAITVIRRLRTAWKALKAVLVIGGLIVWFLLLRPDYLGGTTSYVMVSGKSMQPTYQTGDMVIVRERDRYRTGDVISYTVPSGQLAEGARIIHRVAVVLPDGRYRTKGDNRRTTDLYEPRVADIDGAQMLHIPGAGRWIMFIRQPWFLATAAALMMFFALGGAALDRHLAARDADPEKERPDGG